MSRPPIKSRLRHCRERRVRLPFLSLLEREGRERKDQRREPPARLYLSGFVRGGEGGVRYHGPVFSISGKQQSSGLMLVLSIRFCRSICCCRSRCRRCSSSRNCCIVYSCLICQSLRSI